MSKYFISVDGGGTKTEFALKNADTGKITSCVKSGSNYKNNDLRSDKQNIAESTLSVLSESGITPDDIEKIVFGISGIDSDKDYAFYYDLIKTIGIDMSRVVLMNDCEFTLRGLVDDVGICIVCGTGGIAYGINKEESVRCGGWGMPYGDLGSGSWIGAEAIKIGIKALDGQFGSNPKDCMEIVSRLQRFENDSEPLQQTLNSLDVPTSASVARDVFELAETGNKLCSDILDKATSHIADYIATAYEKLHTEPEMLPIVYAGGINTNASWRRILEPKTAALIPIPLKWILPDQTAAVNGLNIITK